VHTVQYCTVHGVPSAEQNCTVQFCTCDVLYLYSLRQYRIPNVMDTGVAIQIQGSCCSGTSSPALNVLEHKTSHRITVV